MRVGINLLWLAPGRVGGSEEYTVRLLIELAERRSVSVVLYGFDELLTAHPQLVEGHEVRTLSRGGGNKGVRVATESTWLRARAASDDLDLIHHAGGILPVGDLVADRGWAGRWASTRPSVLTLHDIQPITHPERFAPAKRRFNGATIPRSVRAAQRIVTPTGHVRAKVSDVLGVDGDRIDVVPHGIPLPSAEERIGDVDADRLVLDRHGVDGGFVLYPAITYGHKNHRVLLDAMALLGPRLPTLSLVLTGGPGDAEEQLRDRARELGILDRVARLGRIPAADLGALYRRCAALVFPSTHEGFGAPVIEAMGWGKPVIAAEASAIPEVAAHASLLVEPDDPRAWADAIGRVLGDERVRADLAQRGLRRAARFTPEAAVDALVGCYERTLSPAGIMSDETERATES